MTTTKRHAHRLLAFGGRLPGVRALVTALHGIKHRDHPQTRRSPFDRLHGTTTTGVLPPWLLRSGDAADAHSTVYAGCQPSCVRDALAVIPGLDRRVFVDLGCGKGRALIVASEQPFRRIVGVELAPVLAGAARRNARVVRERYPDRPAIEIVAGDAASVPLPDGDLVVFLYHPFGAEIVARVLSRIAEAVAGSGREIFLIYENPVHGGLVDAHGGFTRWHCRTVPCVAAELGFAPDDRDTVVVWRIGGPPPPALPPEPDAGTPIVVTTAGWRAVLATDLPPAA